MGPYCLMLILLGLIAMPHAAGQEKVNVITLGYVRANSLPSLVYNLPPLNIAIDEVNDMYRDRMLLGLTVITDQNIGSCPALLDETSNLLGRWYYTRRNSSNSLTVAIFPGKRHLIRTF